MKRYSKERSSSRVAWDEANLSFLEANKSPKRKITEPKTPYYPPEGVLDNAEHAQAIWEALNEVASSSSGDKGSWASEGDEDDQAESSNSCHGLDQVGHRLSFSELRKAHYDEFRKSKSLRQEDLAVNDTDDDLDKPEAQDMAVDGNNHGGTHGEDMVVDGMGSLDLQDPTFSSGNWQRDTC
ncbi:hypothetical protein KP509_14G057400 [Ceratopteris richardii]|uniref:Protein phosphatase inhibitor 2 n=1 Tax=Ceratopteris richardii TaxID=49495 RepID=A0A8T2TD35_CERRI|nr:hypothetical protein KP509_14G057400 [Ceratopteris richardii]KAH7415703.1 hypothetical protein KP509_14G057400 [Ceratopteris richardii]KAH7415704.1 hypothetical protein KP509_14G057400 [Ceratopteris richardii]